MRRMIVTMMMMMVMLGLAAMATAQERPVTASVSVGTVAPLGDDAERALTLGWSLGAGLDFKVAPLVSIQAQYEFSNTEFQDLLIPRAVVGRSGAYDESRHGLLANVLVGPSWYVLGGVGFFGHDQPFDDPDFGVQIGAGYRWTHVFIEGKYQYVDSPTPVSFVPVSMGIRF